MQSADFPQRNKILVAQGCNDLPAYNNGSVTVTKWELSPEELELIQKTGCLYLHIHFGQSQPPVRLTVESPFFDASHSESFAYCVYTALILGPGNMKDVVVLNFRDAPAPPMLMLKGGTYARKLSEAPVRDYLPQVGPGNYFVRDLTPEEAEQFGESVALVYVEKDGSEGFLQIPNGPQ